MTRTLPLSILVLSLAMPLAAQVSVTTTTPPPGSKPAQIQDLRVFQKPPDDPEEFHRYGEAAVQKNLLPRARTFFQRAWALGELPTAAYNMACIDVREGKTADAFQHLKDAIGAGFDDETTLEKDPDMDSLRGKPEFAAILAGARKNFAEGEAAVVKEALVVRPAGPPRAILIVLHDASSAPLRGSGPFANEAKKRGLLMLAPRGPLRIGKKGFAWVSGGNPRRAVAAIEAAVEAAKKEAANATLPVLLVGVGRGGTLAYSTAAFKGGFAGVASLGGAYDPGAAGGSGAAANALRGVRLFMGIPRDAPQPLVAAFHHGLESLKGLGISPAVKEWAGGGTSFPPNAAQAAADTLDALTGRKG